MRGYKWKHGYMHFDKNIMCILTRHLGAEQMCYDDDEADSYHEVRIGAGVAFVHDTAEWHDALLDIQANEHVDQTDDDVNEEDDGQVRTAVLTRFYR